jgi:Protein of unknown function with HXXEE motif
VFALHNLEEAPGMAAWSSRLPGRWPPPVTTRQFAIAVGLLTLLMAAVAAWAYLAPAQLAAQMALGALQAAVFVNVFTPHLVMFLRLRRYNPGLVSAVCLSLPFSLFFFRQALAVGWLSATGLAVLLLLAPLVMLASIVASLRLGALLARAL